MLGDNMYGGERPQDFEKKFARPFKPLLDAGVKFYATLGNHDDPDQRFYKPFNMNGERYYTFGKGPIDFFVLDSNYVDPKQVAWLEQKLAGSRAPWKIAFFHHPLYSSGQHAAESRSVIRPALEAALVRNHVNVVLSGHEHLYERVKPQKGIRYFVSGGGGRYLYNVRKSDFDDVAVSEHHFMVAEVAGDAFLFEAVRPDGTLIDCGVDWRTDAAAQKHDRAVDGWLSSCHQALVKTTQ
jgi:3',5'-cyclic AMP phosphodiesterase CpdA